MLIKRVFPNFRISEFGKVLVGYASSQFLSKALNMLSGFLVIRMMNPDEIGLYNGVGIYLGYIVIGHFGILNGLGRELPFQMGKGNIDSAKNLASASWVLSLIVSTIASLIFGVIGIINLIKGNYTIGFVYLSYVVTGFFYLLNSQFLPVLYRNNSDFNSLSKQSIKFGISNIVTVFLVYFFGFKGLILRGMLLPVYQYYLLYKNRPINIEWKFGLSDYKTLFKTGFPIFIIGYINSLWTTVLNQVIFVTGGAFYFGIYSLSNLIQGAFGVIPTAFGVITYPRMTIMFAEGKQVSEIIKANIKTLKFQFVFLLTAAIIIAAVLPILIPIILPKYSNGIIAAQWMCFVPVIQSFDSLNNIYNVVKQQKYLLISLLVGALVGIAYTMICIHFKGFYLEVFPQGLMVGVFVQQTLGLIFIRKLFF
jgi:O-antigen/teichoic acid export membrane protein